MPELAEITIRRAVAADAEAVADLLTRTFQQAFAEANRPEDMAAFLAHAYGPRQQLAEIESATVHTLLAVREQIPVGIAQVRQGPNPPCVATAAPIELWRFYVDRAWHGQGVAQRLMQAAFDQAHALDARSVWLGVWEHNGRAAAFYRKFGFNAVGSQEFLVGEDRQTDLVMVAPLPPSTNGGAHELGASPG